MVLARDRNLCCYIWLPMQDSLLAGGRRKLELVLFITKWARKTNHLPLNLAATMGIHITNHFQSLSYLCTCNSRHQNLITHSFSHSDKLLQMYSYCQGKHIGAVPGVGLLFCWLLFFCFVFFNMISFLSSKKAKVIFWRRDSYWKAVASSPPSPPPPSNPKKEIS